jgi:hypothetical protein
MISLTPITRRHYLKTFLILTTTAGSLLYCSDQGPDKSGTFFGPAITIGNGTARTYVTLDRVGAPIDLGVALTEAALTGLPVASTEFVVALPPEASATVYKHATINWQPLGHGASGTTYALPHFDLHAYMITQAQRDAMGLGNAELVAKMMRSPSAEFVPLGYVAGMAIGQMGMHWTDPAAPERNGERFIHTFFYGSYDGTFMLTEPMVTKAFLETKPTAIVTPIKLPAQYAMHGYHPTSYTVSYDANAKEYRIALTGLVLR